MNKTILLALLFSFTFISSISGQEKRIFTFNKQIIEYYIFSNMTPSFTKFPNHKAKFIIVDSNNNLYEYSKTSEIENAKEARKDRTLYYYLKLPKLKEEKKIPQIF